MLPNMLPKSGFNALVNGRHGVVLYNTHDIVVGRSIAYYGEYFESEVEVFQQIVKPGWHVADVGANIGTHTQALSRLVGPSGWVYAFEVQRLVFQTLCANVANNSLANVDCERLAIDEKPGKLLVEDLNPLQEVNYGGISLGQSQAGKSVQSVTLDKYLDGRPLNFAKIDVEGMELACLKGARDTLNRWKTILYLENDRAEKSRALMIYLNDIGYDIYWHLPLFFNKDNFAKETHHIHDCSYIESGKSYLESIGFAINILCLPKSMNVTVNGDALLKVEDFDEHPLIRGESRFRSS